MKIPKAYAHLAVETTARRLLDRMEGSGAQRAVSLEQAHADESLTRGAMEAFLDGTEERNGQSGVQFEELSAHSEALHRELRAVDLNGDGIDASEQARMSKAGQVAMALAQELMKQEPMAAITAQQLDGLSPDEAVAVVRQAATEHVELGYNVARAILFAHLDNEDGAITGVYKGQKIDDVVGVPETKLMNTEHTWPKSRGVKDTPAVSDLHHLFPTDADVNTRRASYPFGVVEQVRWEDGRSKLGFGKDGHVVFEPPPEHRGNIARALFYVATVYDLPMIQGEPELLLQWSKDDPVDPQERQRNEEISRFQRSRNPFVDHPELAERLLDTIETRPPPEYMRANKP